MANLGSFTEERAIADRVQELGAKPKRSKSGGTDQKEVIKAKAEKIVTALFVEAILNIDQRSQSESEATPPPSWLSGQDFALAEEVSLTAKLAENEQQVSALRQERENLLNGLSRSVTLKALLFEKGKPLERAILEALRFLGFTAQQFKEGDSEFDAIFVTPEGQRLLGEAEGKDERAVNIDKLDQLDRNLREDFQRVDVTQYAKDVLFGNAYRLPPPSERGEFFTEKCILGARRSVIALVRTTDLFQVARYLKECQDPEFAGRCRTAILQTVGEVVVFPSLPQDSDNQMRAIET